jgi:hypothetical protein
MITSFDDYMIHQTSEPVSSPAPTDRNFYDRYWMNGFDRDGGFVFEVGFGIYPNRHVMDGHFSVSQGGAQHAFHASRRAPADRRQSVAGPLSIEVIEPMRALRVRVAPNDTGVECDLVFRARSFPTQEPKNHMAEGVRVIMDTTRFTQFGVWEGSFTVAGESREVRSATTLGIRDKSWGVRPVGEPEAGAPGLLNSEPGVYWVWCPIFFDDFCTQFGTFEDRDGRPTQVGGAVVPLYSSAEEIPDGEEPGHRDVVAAKHRVRWREGTRLAASAELELTSEDGRTFEIEVEPLIRFHMLGIGYQHPEWGHGFWRGEEAYASESWGLDDMDLLDYKHIHNHQIVRARAGDKVGVGTLETVVFGRHDPSGFKDILDGAPPVAR